jgi:hypothetical protein
MPSRLSSLLVRDGLVGVKRMEKAFQRQVIYGGCLDTILLEMSLVPEERLTQYLALASGLPPASRDEGQSIEEAAVAVIAKEIADQYRAVPVALDGEALRILVCAPIELTELEDLADLLDRPLQPLITPEYRWHLVFAAAYGLDPPARFTTLARSLDIDAGESPVGRARSVIIDHEARPIPVATDQTERTPAPIAVTGQDTDRIVVEDISARTRQATIMGFAPTKASGTIDKPKDRDKTDTVPEPLSRPTPRPRGDGVPSEPIPKPIVSFTSSPSTGIPKAVAESGPSKKRPAGPRLLRRPPTTPISTEGRDSPLPIARARETLATAEDRDSVFLTLLRAARSRARWAGLLTVQGGAAIGRVALAEPGLDTAAVNTVLIPLDAVSPFRAVIGNLQPHIGPLVSGDPAIDAMLLRFGGTTPPSALILPVVLRDRVVALVVAHRVQGDIRLADVTELLPIATAASDALGRLIVKHKSAGYRAPSGQVPAVQVVEPGQVETKRVAKSPGGWAAPAERPSIPPVLEDLKLEEAPARPIDDLIADIESAKEGWVEDAINEAVERAPEALGVLMRKFPGTLRIERFGVTGRPLRAAQYGGLLELVIRLGAVSSELLIEKMSAPQRDIRFYATVCAAELRPRNVIFALVERLFDQDFGVRAIAIEALAGYPMADLGQALSRARRAIHSGDPDVVAAAAAAIVELGDVEAVPDLIGAAERSDRGGEHARKALVSLTAQDFGPSEKRWRKWYDTARQRHRVEWLIEGLAHKEDAVRETAINSLRRLTGEYFGYHYDLPRRERDLAAERWAAWWRDTGVRRFIIREDERHRPTAQLPIRRD